MILWEIVDQVTENCYFIKMFSENVLKKRILDWILACDLINFKP